MALKQSLSKLLCKVRSPMTRKQVLYHRPKNGKLEMPDLESYWLTERLIYRGRSLSKDTVLGKKCERRFSLPGV